MKLTNKELSFIQGGRINWGYVGGSCASGALITGVFSGPFYLVGAGVGCASGAAVAVIDSL